MSKDFQQQSPLMGFVGSTIDQFTSHTIAASNRSLEINVNQRQNQYNELQCSGQAIWDSKRARFDPCALPFISLFPVIVSLLVALTYIFDPILLKRPLWLKVIVQEVAQKDQETSSSTIEGRKYMIQNFLFCFSVAGLICQVFLATLTSYSWQEMAATLPWIVSGGILSILRAKAQPASMLFLFSAILINRVIMFVHDEPSHGLFQLGSTLGVIITTICIISVLYMPLRPIDLPIENIASSNDRPNPSLRSPEDNLKLWQFMTVSWFSPLLTVGSSKKLDREDVWSLSFEWQHKRLHYAFQQIKGSVLGRVVIANGFDLCVTSSLTIFEALANLATPVLLQLLLQTMQDSNSSRNPAVTYAVITLVLRLAAAQASVINLWYCRRCYERSRARSSETSSLEPAILSKGINSNDSTLLRDCFRPLKRLSSLPQRLWNVIRGRSKKRVESQKPAMIGTLLNLMRGDAYQLAQGIWEFPTMLSRPFGLILSIVLLYRLVGWPCLVGIAAVCIGQIVNALITRQMLKVQKAMRVASDERLEKTSHFIEAIRHLRWYGWAPVWLDEILEKRRRELQILVYISSWEMLLNFSSGIVTGALPVATFYAYTVLAGEPLRADVAFPALSLFAMVQGYLEGIPQIVRQLTRSWVAKGRLEAFMQEPEKPVLNKLQNTSGSVEISGASFSWPGYPGLVLGELNLSFRPGLTVIQGEVGSGKTALLQAILGELDQRSGQIAHSDGGIGFCAQRPWLQSMSIRANILFGATFEESRYEQVIDACALRPDLAEFSHGDLTEFGENGIGLSGGQKARIALARAVYSDTKMLLLDDPLSALDHHTAEIIVQECIGGPLLRNRITVLVTHRIELIENLDGSIPIQVVELSGGRATIIKDWRTSETYQSDSGPTPDSHQLHATDLSELQSSMSPEISTVPLSGTEIITDTLLLQDSPMPENPNPTKVSPERFHEPEHRADGGIQLKVYWQYIKSGDIRLWIMLIIALTLFRLFGVAEDWFLNVWGEAYSNPDAPRALKFLRLPSPEVNVRPWLVVYTCLVAIGRMLFLLVDIAIISITYVAGRTMFRSVMERVSHAKFRFYDVTPIGRLLNRLTSDMSMVDGDIGYVLYITAFYGVSFISSIIVMASVTPYFLIISILMSLGFFRIFNQFLPTSQSLRRLETVSLSPLISNFGALMDGITTIRAFNVQDQFLNSAIEATEAFQNMDHFYWSAQGWLMYRFDNLASISTFILTLVALFSGISTGLTAFGLLATMKLVSSTHRLCKQYGQLQMDFVSVERIVELLFIEQELPGTIIPPAYWPTMTGDIVFENVSIRYAPHLDMSLSNVSLKIKGGSTTVIIGRTGSGKSTLATSLLATVVPESGRILIDGQSIATVDLQTLRRRITFLAQDPVLFPGSMRQNIDPIKEHTDHECDQVLQRTCGKYQWTLETNIEAGGRNLSQGQRQMIGLARAILRRSSVVILDEATASIDTETATQIQDILRQELVGSTIITIAHRVEAVKNADYYVRLDRGRVVDEGPATSMSTVGTLT